MLDWEQPDEELDSGQMSEEERQAHAWIIDSLSLHIKRNSGFIDLDIKMTYEPEEMAHFIASVTRGAVELGHFRWSFTLLDIPEWDRSSYIEAMQERFPTGLTIKDRNTMSFEIYDRASELLQNLATGEPTRDFEPSN